MPVLSVNVPQQTIDRVHKLASSTHKSVDKVIEELVDDTVTLDRDEAQILGAFADDPEFVDQVFEEAMKFRRERNKELLGG